MKLPRKPNFKGIVSQQWLSKRAKHKRGGQDKHALDLLPCDMLDYLQKYTNYLAVRNYSPRTIQRKTASLILFITWAQERDLLQAEEITKPILETFQSYLYRYKKRNGKPLSINFQRAHINEVQQYFRWLCRQNYLLYNPASELELPRPEKRLPEDCLSPKEIQRIMNQPDIADPLGVRDRAILETFYATGLRRRELVMLQLSDINLEKQILYVRQGKGKKDRVVPLQGRALQWIETYLNDVRPKLLLRSAETALFISVYGEGINPDVLSRKVSKYLKQADITKKGCCHLFRHSCATHMLENGADTRFIQQLLGHDSLESTQIYTKVSIKQLQQVHKMTHPSNRENIESP